ncbi:MAG: LacI family transcriptional regulator [Verrucomicrobia bacterium]|nr:LacI family transcriptional regulator [Verrucomicrobiota bacterium]
MSEASPTPPRPRRNLARVRLLDIASRAKVSIMTVSKAMRDEPDISSATKSKIKLLAQQMGYVPNSAAASLRNTRTRLLGVVLPSLSHPYWIRVLSGIEEEAHARGYHLLVGQTLQRAEREEQVLRGFFARNADGFLVAPVYRLAAQAPVYQFLAAQGTPAVVLGQRALFCADFPNVECGDLQAGERATRHLLELGHRHIAFFAGPVVSPQSQERYEGYRRALREAGLTQDDKCLYNAGTSMEEGEAAALQFLHERCAATAIVAINDMVAAGVMSVLTQQGISVPRQVSVVGAGNFHFSDKLPSPLTTMHLPKFSLGTAAVDLLLKQLEGHRVESKRLPCELIARASTAPPP